MIDHGEIIWKPNEQKSEWTILFNFMESTPISDGVLFLADKILSIQCALSIKLTTLSGPIFPFIAKKK